MMLTMVMLIVIIEEFKCNSSDFDVSGCTFLQLEFFRFHTIKQLLAYQTITLAKCPQCAGFRLLFTL